MIADTMIPILFYRRIFMVSDAIHGPEARRNLKEVIAR